MQSRTISIIGAGLGGLSTGCFAQMNGFKSQIFENHFVPGGVAASWKRKEFLFDGGIHYVAGFKKGTKFHKVLTKLGAGDMSLYKEMEYYGKIIDQTQNKSAVVGKDLNKLRNDLKNLVTEFSDKKMIDEIIDCSREFKGKDYSSFGQEDAHELANFKSKLKLIWQGRSVLKYFSNKRYTQRIEDFAKEARSDFLQKFLINYFTPEIPVWFMLMTLASLSDGNVGYIKNGSSSFTKAMESQYKKLGGNVNYNSRVIKILVKDNKAIGVKLANGKEYFSDYVISAGDGYNTLYNLLDGKYVTPKLDKLYKTRQIYKPFLFSSYGVNYDLSKEIPLNSILLKEPIIYGDNGKSYEIKEMGLRILNYGDKFAPKGKSVIQGEFSVEFDYWHDLRKRNRQEYIKAKENLSKQIIKQIDNIYPGISQKIETWDMATPSTAHRFTLNQKGSWGGWVMDARRFNENIERILPGLKNFYMAGQWALSCGVSSVIYSGKHAIELLKKGL